MEIVIKAKDFSCFIELEVDILEFYQKQKPTIEKIYLIIESKVFVYELNKENGMYFYDTLI